MNIIGEGNYSKVYEDEGYAIKIFKENILESSSEIDILFNLNSENLIKGVEIYKNEFNNKTCIKMEKAIGKLKFSFTYEKKKKILYGLTLGLNELHKNNYLHLDITFDNCMYSGSEEDPIGKLIDYGLSVKMVKNIPEIYTQRKRITVINRPYEHLLNPNLGTYSKKSDIWSLAIVFIEFMLGKKFTENMQVYKYPVTGQILWEYSMFKYTELILSDVEKYLNENLSDFEEKNLFIQLIDKMIYDRIDTNIILQHDYFKEFEQKNEESEEIKEEKIILKESEKYELDFTINKLINYCLTNMWESNIEILSGAIDLFIRFYLKNKIRYNMDQLENIIYCCLVIYYKIYVLESELPEFLKYLEIVVIGYEILIISTINGRITNKNSPFEKSTSKSESLFLFRYFFLKNNIEDYINYENILEKFNLLKIDRPYITSIGELSVDWYGLYVRGINYIEEKTKNNEKVLYLSLEIFFQIFYYKDYVRKFKKDVLFETCVWIAHVELSMEYDLTKLNTDMILTRETMIKLKINMSENIISLEGDMLEKLKNEYYDTYEILDIKKN